MVTLSGCPSPHPEEVALEQDPRSEFFMTLLLSPLQTYDLCGCSGDTVPSTMVPAAHSELPSHWETVEQPHVAGPGTGHQRRATQTDCSRELEQMSPLQGLGSKNAVCDVGCAGTLTCSLRSVMVFCISRTKSLKSFVPGTCGRSREGAVPLTGCFLCFPMLLGEKEKPPTDLGMS